MDAIREIVIESIERCRKGNDCNECAYDDGNIKKDGCINEMLDDALELLKDQETVFEADGDGYADGELVFDEWYCHACGYHFQDDDMPTAKYCPECGRKFRRNEFKARTNN